MKRRYRWPLGAVLSLLLVLLVLRNGFVQAFNARYEQAPPKAD